MSKERIHHVDEAAGNHDLILLHALHGFIQIARGHYRLTDLIQSEVEPGRDRLTFDRIHTEHSHASSAPNLTEARVLAEHIKTHYVR